MSLNQYINYKVHCKSNLIMCFITDISVPTYIYFFLYFNKEILLIIYISIL